jgi:uncharacterized surface protein with fasciclin (FAS1) repeats
MRHLKIAAAAIAVLTAVSLTACGSSSTTAASSPTPTESSMAPSSPAVSAPAAAGTIVDVAATNPDFSTVVAAVKAAGLADTLSGPGPFTVFAPTNEAFAALPAGLVDKLLKPENKAVLTKILTYHVLGSMVMAADVMPGKVATLEGSTIDITTANGVKVNDATVVKTDIVASNGVIHVIDKVLLPPDVDVSML